MLIRTELKLMSEIIEYNNYILDFIKYVKVYEKKKRKKITKALLAKYIIEKYCIFNAYAIHFNKLSYQYTFNYKDCLFKNSLDSKNNLVLVFPKYNILFFGGEDNMKRISIVNTYYNENFKEKLFNFTIKDEHDIFCTSSNIVIADIPLESIFYTNIEGKEKTLAEVLLDLKA